MDQYQSMTMKELRQLPVFSDLPQGRWKLKKSELCEAIVTLLNQQEPNVEKSCLETKPKRKTFSTGGKCRSLTSPVPNRYFEVPKSFAELTKENCQYIRKSDLKKFPEFQINGGCQSRF